MRLIFLLFTFCFSTSAFAQIQQDWKELKSDHFIVYFTQAEDFPREVLNKAEVYYSRIASDLNYPRYSEFWTWDNRVKIYIHPDLNSFLQATGQPAWSRGMADYKGKQIISYAWSGGFLESLLPHEMAHLIFRDFVGFKGEVPLWLDEGVAQWAEPEKRKIMDKMAKELYDKSGLLSLNDMMRLDVRNITSNDKVYLRLSRKPDAQDGLLFLSGDNLVNTYYIQAVSLVGFLIQVYGQESFTVFCRGLRDGKSLEEALKGAYPLYIRSLQDLEDKWREHLGGQR